MSSPYTPIRGPFVKHAFAKSVDKGEDAWVQQRDLPCGAGAPAHRCSPFATRAGAPVRLRLMEVDTERGRVFAGVQQRGLPCVAGARVSGSTAAHYGSVLTGSAK